MGRQIGGNLTIDAWKTLHQSARDMERKVTVCAACLRASCWQGKFYCDEYRAASTTEKTVSDLMVLGLEHASYWEPK